MPSVDEVTSALHQQLSPPRAAHVLRVADTAVRLAQRHGVDAVQARLAGLLHDWYREVPDAQIVELAYQAGVLSGKVSPGQLVPAALHGPVAARLLPRRWPDLSHDVLAAIDCHTTGAPDMTPLGCLLYVADMTEPAHDFPGVGELRASAERDLWAAALEGMNATLRRLLERGRAIDLRSIAARNALLARAAEVGATGRA